MKGLSQILKLSTAVALLTGAAGCESNDTGGGASVYSGSGFEDPWYYGGYYDDVDVIVTPPDRPESPPRPTHPIAPVPSPRPTPMPMPSIPRMPMPRAR
jgi:hypothetical protein